jgi:hypothetical protein
MKYRMMSLMSSATSPTGMDKYQMLIDLGNDLDKTE